MFMALRGLGCSVASALGRALLCFLPSDVNALRIRRPACRVHASTIFPDHFSVMAYGEK